MHKLKKLTKSPKKTFIFILICLISMNTVSLQSAQAATQTLPSNNTWRLYTPLEQDQLHIGNDSGVGWAGHPSVVGANPQNASQASPGWTPDGATDAIPQDNTDLASIIYDMPKIDLGCSPDVKISITSGTAETDITSTTTGKIYISIVNNYSESLIINRDTYVRQSFGDVAPGDSVSLVSDYQVPSQAPAFGMKVILSVQIIDTGTPDTSSWDVHDLALAYTYDDVNGTCNSFAPDPVAVGCNDNYLSTKGVALNAGTLDYFKTLLPNVENIAGTNHDDIRSTGGLTVNPNLDEPTDNYYRIVELDIIAQTPLLNAGTVEMHVDLDFDFVQNGGTLFTLISRGDASAPSWEVFYGYGQRRHITTTAYLPSGELANARIFLVILTRDATNQIESKISNAKVNISQLSDVSVCGISAINSSDGDTTTTTTTTKPGATGTVNGNGLNSTGITQGTLPETGDFSLILFLITMSIISCGTIFQQSVSDKKSSL